MCGTVTEKFEQEDLMMSGKRNITAVYIRGAAFKASTGGRRHQILLNLKRADEKRSDLWVLKYVAVFGLGVLAGSAALVWFPLV